MAYGNTKIDNQNISKSKSPQMVRRSRGRRKNKKETKAPVSRPIIDEENPIPAKYEGEIVFNKTIYSKGIFNSKIDSKFSELSVNEPIIEIERFFELYNEIFFDIPREGENSHTTIVETSLDYLNNYQNPLQDLVDAQAIELEEAIRLKEEAEARIQNFLATQASEEIAAEVQAEAETAAYAAQYGSDFVNNPSIKYNQLQENLVVADARDILRGTLKNNKRDLEQAKKKEDGGASKKSYNQWKASIQKRAERKTEPGLLEMLELTKNSIASRNGYQI